jgi:hypothetical protein
VGKTITSLDGATSNLHVRLPLLPTNHTTTTTILGAIDLSIFWKRVTGILTLDRRKTRKCVPTARRKQLMGWSLQVILLRLGSKVGITLDLFLKLFLKLLLCEDSSHFKKSLPIAQQDQHPLGRPKAASFSIISQWFGASVVSIPFFPSVTNWKELNANGHKCQWSQVPIESCKAGHPVLSPYSHSY